MPSLPDPSSGPPPLRALQAVEEASPSDPDAAARALDGRVFLELRRKVQESELLSASTERLLQKIRFSGRLSIVVQNGRVLKSGYEEGYFRRKNDFRALNT